jgi:STE24 endopeptidase
LISQFPSAHDPSRYHRIRISFYFVSLLETIFFLWVIQMTGVAQELQSYLSGHGLPWWAIAAVFAASLHVTMVVLQSPQHVYKGYILEKKAGLSNEPFRQWLTDEFKAGALGLGLHMLVVVAFFGIVRMFGTFWWLGVAGFWLGMTVCISMVLPQWIIPLFYPMRVLSPSTLKERLMKRVRDSRLSIRDIYEIALSRKTRKANAAVVGFGATRRIVLGDTLIKMFSPSEIESVLCHELAHYERRHILKRIAISFVGMLAILWGLAVSSSHWVAWSGALTLSDAGIYPTLLLILAVLQFFGLPLQNLVSRRMETEADAYALRAADPTDFISAMKKLGKLNYAHEKPHPIIEFWFYSHPAIWRRIQAAVAAKGIA